RPSPTLFPYTTLFRSNALTGFISGQRSGFSGITNTTVYDVRLQPCRMMASSGGAVPTNCDASWGNLLDRRYDFHLGNGDNGNVRSEEHTSELQSRENL